jgi:aminoglycoside phosphotransferase (APT) family kinase protein
MPTSGRADERSLTTATPQEEWRRTYIESRCLVNGRPPSVDGVDIDVSLVRRLVVAQFPQWTTLPVTATGANGWDTVVFRLGSELAVRLPRRKLGAEHLSTEYRWLPVIAPHLPLPTPVPICLGAPAEGYPWPWTVTPWLPGQAASDAPVRHQRETAERLARFITDLHALDTTGGPASTLRSSPLAGRDPTVRAAITTTRGTSSTDALTAVWNAALAAGPWTGPEVWVHGDLHPANLLTIDGRLRAVIDFGLLGVGDPASDLIVAWTALSPPGRSHLRRVLSISDATWARARGRALDFALMCLSRAPNDSAVGSIARRTVEQLLTNDG